MAYLYRIASMRFGSLCLPPTMLRLGLSTGGAIRVFDTLRQSWIVLTPEEWVRQHFVAMLSTDLHYPFATMANEVPLTLNGTSRRCDTVVYSPVGLRPLMIVEYKAPNIAISQRTFDQIVRYNMVLQVPWLVVSNGKNHYCCNVDYTSRKVNFTPDIPDFATLIDSVSRQ